MYQKLNRHTRKQKKNGYWTCEVTLTKGEASYRFVVNNSYYVDFKNTLYVGKDENTLSKKYMFGDLNKTVIKIGIPLGLRKTIKYYQPILILGKTS